MYALHGRPPSRTPLQFNQNPGEGDWNLARQYILDERFARERDDQREREDAREEDANNERERLVDEDEQRQIERAGLHPDNVESGINEPHRQLMSDIIAEAQSRQRRADEAAADERGEMVIEEGGRRVRKRSKKSRKTKKSRKSKKSRKARKSRKSRKSKKSRKPKKSNKSNR